MAQSASYTPRHSARFGNERRWLLVIAALSMFAYYVASGHYAFTRPQASPSSESGAVAETSSTSVVAQSGQIQLASAASAELIPSGEPAQIAETSSTQVAVETQQQSAEPVAQVQTAATAASAPAVSAPQPAALTAPPAPAAPASPNVIERWRALGVLIETQGQEWDAQSLANIDAALSALPAGLRAQLGNPTLGQLHVLVNSQGRALSGKQPYGGAANFFSTGDGVNELVMYPRQRVSTILHELGHAYNLRRVPAGNYAKVLIDPEMESFMAATGWQVLATRDEIAQSVDHMRLNYQYNGTFRWQGLSRFDPLEDFGNSFAMYFYDPAGLKAQSPERYAWMAANLPK